MTDTGDDTEKAVDIPSPKAFSTYQDYLVAVRKLRGMRLKDVSDASAHPDWPNAKAKMPALSRMEGGDIKNPSFRQIVRYARGYQVSLEDLASFFFDDYERGQGDQ